VACCQRRGPAPPAAGDRARPARGADPARAAAGAPARGRALPRPSASALAQLTADIHAPLANRLGIWQLKWELEDLAFRYLQPDTYKRIAAAGRKARRPRALHRAAVQALLRDALAAAGIRAEVAGRPKHIYSIWKKMQRKDVPFGELYDLRAVRVLVDDVPACYAALGVVHSAVAPIPASSTTTSPSPRATTTARCTPR
jgi:GTP pyrophosphokinase